MRSPFTPGMARPVLRLIQAAFGCLLVAACVVLDAQAAAETPGKITVEGVGTTVVKPDIAEIRSTLTGSAPLATDAEKKYREHRRRAFEMLQKLNRKDLVIEARGRQSARECSKTAGRASSCGTTWWWDKTISKRRDLSLRSRL
jgi:hypothetical protein